MASPSELLQKAVARPASTTSATTRSGRASRSSSAALDERGAAQRSRRGALPIRASPAHLRAAPAGRGLVPPPSRDRRRADRGAADRARPAAHRLDGAVVPARRGPERPLAAAAGSRRSRARRRRPSSGPTRASPAEAAVGAGRDAPRRRTVPADADRADGVPGPHGARLQGALFQAFAHVPSYSDVAARRRPHVDLPVRAPGAQAAAVGRADAAVAAEVPVAPAVARRTSTGCSPTPAS